MTPRLRMPVTVELPASDRPWRLLFLDDGAILAVNPKHLARRITREGIVAASHTEPKGKTDVIPR